MEKVWLISGANRGLGRAFAEEAAARGDKVIAGMRHMVGDEFFRQDNVLAAEMDVTDKGQVQKAVQAGLSRFGRIDVLINNAGFGMSGAFEEVTDEELRQLMEADYFGVVNVTRAVLPVMRQQNSGRILNIASQGGLMAFTGSTAYCSAKFAVVGLSLTLREEVAPFGIEVSAVCPGSFRTDFRDASSMRLPKDTMEAYQGSQVAAVREFLTQNNHQQEGDPKKAAKFICDMVQKDSLPRRILIGAKCCEQVKNDLQAQLEEIDTYSEAAGRTDFMTRTGKLLRG